VVYLLHGHFLPEDRLAELMGDLFGVRLVPATIARMSHNCASRLQGFMAVVRAGVNEAKVKHLDETGFRIGGHTKWLHIASTGLLTFIEKEEWARKMQTLLRRACHATNLAREGGVALAARLIARIQQRYNSILAEGIAFHEAQPALRPAKRHGRKPRRVGHNLLLRLQRHRDDVLRFLTDPDVPFTNTQAERDARMMKLRQKISGGFRSRSGADDFAIVRGAISTAKKHGTLTRDPQELIYTPRPG
jgi:transposase